MELIKEKSETLQTKLQSEIEIKLTKEELCVTLAAVNQMSQHALKSFFRENGLMGAEFSDIAVEGKLHELYESLEKIYLKLGLPVCDEYSRYGG